MWDVVGQERATAIVAASLSSGRPPHAYLLVGPSNVGKYRLALQMAQALNCEANTSSRGPCGACGPCRRIAAGLHADVQTITVESADGAQHSEIRIAQIREVEHTIVLSPYEGHTRVVIIDGAEAMNGESQNAFLKTLEEPPPQVVFILVTAREEKLLPTIRSRCQRIEFHSLPIALVERAATDRLGLAPEQARLLARLSRGRIGWVLAAAQEADSSSRLAIRAEALEMAQSLSSLSLGERFAVAEQLAARFGRDRPGVLETLEIWREWWRDVLIVQAGAGEGITNVDMAALLAEDAHRYDPEDVVTFLRTIGATAGYLEANVNARLALETLMLTHPEKHPPP